MLPEPPRQEYIRQCQTSLQHVREHNRKLGIMSLSIHRLEKTLIAEGIETQSQLQYIKDK